MLFDDDELMNDNQEFNNDTNAFADFEEQEDLNQQEIFSTQAKKSGSLGAKSVAIIVAIFFFILAGIFLFLDNLVITKKTQTTQQTQQSAEVIQEQSNNNNQQSTDVIQEPSSNNQQSTEVIQNPSSTTQSSGGMQEIPSNTVIDYTGEVYTSTGIIHNRQKFLSNSQVIYCLQINTTIGDSNKIISYYCGYNVYNSVEEGDTVTVSYQIVSDTCYSVNTLTK